MNHYYPYGDRFVDPRYTVTAQGAGSDNGRLFAGKEQERTSGLYDFEARFGNTFLGRFTTMDPMAEKYYSISPYAYCAGNPVNLVDPDGMDYWAINKTGEIIRIDDDKEEHRLYYRQEDNTLSNQFVRISNEHILEDLTFDPDAEDGKIYKTQSSAANDIFKVFKFAADHSDKEWVVHRNGNLYTLGTILDNSSASRYQKFGIQKPDASIHSHPDTAFSEEAYSMGYGATQYETDLKKVELGQSPMYNYVYFPESRNVYQVNANYPVFIRKATSYKSFFWGTLNLR